jgi:radical SAM superfamily enzyme YgiQ (UPF0313 family)
MKILLVMPSFNNAYWKRLGKKIGPRSEPLNLLYLATYLNNNGHKVEIVDCETEGISIEDLEFRIQEKKYDLIGVSMVTAMYSQAVAICKLVKNINQNIYVVVGGNHATLRPIETLEKEDSIDFVTIGEAELTFLELVDALENKKDYKKIKGIVYRDNNKVIKNEERERIEDLDFFPMPDRKLIKMQYYRPSVSYYKRLPAYTILTTRGCPYRCMFCATAKTGYRMHSVKRVIEEMQMLIEDYGAKEILIRDDTFTLNKARTIELCDAIIKKGLNKKVIWDCITRANLVDYELLKKMKEANCCGIHFGVEGGTQKLIDAIHKDEKIETIINAFKWCRELGIETRAYMMLGLPTSTKEDDIDTINFIKSVDPDWAQFTITTPYPGTELFDKATEFGKFNTDISDWDKYLSWSGYGDTELVWTSNGRSSKEIKELQLKAMREFYYRPKVILRKIKDLNNWKALKNYSTGAIALFK